MNKLIVILYQPVRIDEVQFKEKIIKEFNCNVEIQYWIADNDITNPTVHSVGFLNSSLHEVEIFDTVLRIYNNMLSIQQTLNDCV